LARNLSADEESFVSAGTVFQFAAFQVKLDYPNRLETRDSSVAVVSIDILENISFSTTKPLRVAPSE
jgi:hypothetical protein